MKTLPLNMHQKSDMKLLIVIMLLLGFGVVMVTSASIDIAHKTYNNPFHFTVRQTIYLLIGFFAAFTMYKIPLKLWQSSSILLLAVAYILLILVLVPGLGRQVKGAVRWLDLGPFVVQVSEIAKLFAILYLASFIVRHHQQVINTFTGFIKPLCLLMLMVALLLAEPDFGASVVLISIALGMLFLAGARLVPFFALMIGAIIAFALLAISSPYRLRRLTSFMDPWADPFDTGFQLTQSLIAIGSGSWNGVGLGGSIQKLSYLPEAHNDFLFAILAEELGLIGVTLVIALFMYLIYCLFKVANRAHQIGHAYGAFVAYGIALWIALQMFVNLGVNMGVLPTKGLTLPLMSAGGSSTVIMCAALGIVFRVSYETREMDASCVGNNKRGKAKTRLSV